MAKTLDELAGEIIPLVDADTKIRNFLLNSSYDLFNDALYDLNTAERPLYTLGIKLIECKARHDKENSNNEAKSENKISFQSSYDSGFSGVPLYHRFYDQVSFEVSLQYALTDLEIELRLYHLVLENQRSSNSKAVQPQQTNENYKRPLTFLSQFSIHGKPGYSPLQRGLFIGILTMTALAAVGLMVAANILTAGTAMFLIVPAAAIKSAFIINVALSVFIYAAVAVGGVSAPLALGDAIRGVSSFIKKHMPSLTSHGDEQGHQPLSNNVPE